MAHVKGPAARIEYRHSGGNELVVREKPLK
jgi:hypothetical protein